MAILTPRDGASLARVVQAALNVAGPAAVSIVTAGTGAGVQLPDHLSAQVEADLGWRTEADETPSPHSPASAPPPVRKTETAPTPAPKKSPRRARRGEKE
jgi:hypothetical protein